MSGTVNQLVVVGAGTMGRGIALIAAAAGIDTAARLGLNHPMGPLELLDMVGLDVRLAALETLFAAYGEHFRPTPLHRRLVAAGRLGNKAGGGVHAKRPARD
jgi:3-hydroxybutyryl-CoA dehydrogenase